MAELVKPGQKAPDFSVPSATDGSVSSEDFKGKAAVVVFWKSTCPYCVKEAPGLSRIFKEHAGNVAVVAIHVGRDDAPTARDFAKSHGFEFPIGVDADKKVREAYGLRVVPTLVWLNPDGTVAAVYEGSSPGLQEAVKNALQAANAGKEIPAYEVSGDG